jgi:hypothetical protein
VGEREQLVVARQQHLVFAPHPAGATDVDPDLAVLAWLFALAAVGSPCGPLVALAPRRVDVVEQRRRRAARCVALATVMGLGQFDVVFGQRRDDLGQGLPERPDPAREVRRPEDGDRPGSLAECGVVRLVEARRAGDEPDAGFGAGPRVLDRRGRAGEVHDDFGAVLGEQLGKGGRVVDRVAGDALVVSGIAVDRERHRRIVAIDGCVQHCASHRARRARDPDDRHRSASGTGRSLRSALASRSASTVSSASRCSVESAESGARRLPAT